MDDKKTACIFTVETARAIQKKYANNPGYAAHCLGDILDILCPDNVSPEDEKAVRGIIKELFAHDHYSSPEDLQEATLRREILDFYVPRQLVKSIVANGSIPHDSQETLIGVGFIDIADYSYLSKFLSPKENQTLLNGLYSCFARILAIRGGYLNKSEGDSIMFQFGGPLDPNVKRTGTEDKNAFDYISTELFNACVEMQRISYKFNDADESILDFLVDEEEKTNVRDAFKMIHYMRTDPFLSNAFNALYQIRIRIGANVGRVSIGNFGPPGSKHWDIIGNPVIEAKRMESTSPIGGLRISESFYKALDGSGIIDKYYEEFLGEAKKLNGYFRDIKKEEVFQYSSVLLKDKKNVSFRTYSVQVNPGLPESIMDQIALLLEKGDAGADKIVELIKYYRGNAHILEGIEELCREHNIRLRKGKMVFYLFPEKFQDSLRIMGGDKSKVEEFVEKKYTLFDILKTLGGYQDRLKQGYFDDETIPFESYDHYMDSQLRMINDVYKRSIKNSIHNTYFFNVIFPLIFKSIKASILEYQSTIQHKLAEQEAAKGAALLSELRNLFPGAGADSGGEIPAEEELEDLEVLEPV